ASDTQKKLSGVIEEESTRLNQIVTEFLDFARPQTPNLRECHLNEIIEKNLVFLKPELEKKGIAVTHNLDGRSYKLQADHDLIYRAILNILINAMQSMKDGGSLDISVEEEKGHFRIDVEDTGNGVGEDHIKKIFNPFFTTKEKGTGLGLSIVRKIIEEGHGGKVTIESKEGRGTKMQLHLPIIK
ncbi:MAG: GHKL domain-containing protein, partial [Deltaproteobacteria bacterium]|nr:GHKL domain-containing protein [Deltaproteobacteria bacterium]